MGPDEKPVILVMDDDEGCAEAVIRFAEKRQLIYTATDLRGAVEFFKARHELGLSAVLLNPRTVTNPVIPGLINDMLRHRTMLHVWTENPDDVEIQSWGEKHNAYSYFSKGTLLRKDSWVEDPGLEPSTAICRPDPII